MVVNITPRRAISDLLVNVSLQIDFHTTNYQIWRCALVLIRFKKLNQNRVKKKNNYFFFPRIQNCNKKAEWNCEDCFRLKGKRFRFVIFSLICILTLNIRWSLMEIMQQSFRSNLQMIQFFSIVLGGFRSFFSISKFVFLFAGFFDRSERPLKRLATFNFIMKKEKWTHAFFFFFYCRGPDICKILHFLIMLFSDILEQRNPFFNKCSSCLR